MDSQIKIWDLKVGHGRPVCSPGLELLSLCGVMKWLWHLASGVSQGLCV